MCIYLVDEVDEGDDENFWNFWAGVILLQLGLLKLTPDCDLIMYINYLDG